MSEQRGESPRWPPDPAGTQPKIDHGALELSGKCEQLLLTAGGGKEPPAGPAARAQPPGPTDAAPGRPQAPPHAVDHAGVSERVTQQPAGALAVGEAGPSPGPHQLLPRAQTPGSTRQDHPAVSGSTPRFQFLFGVLGALGTAAVALAIGLALGHASQKPARAVPWSSWQPISGSGDPAAQIAKHVGAQYRLPDGRQLLKVTGGPQSIGGQPVVLALRTSGSEPTSLPNDGVFYQLCGGGSDCSISGGKATVERGLLVRREALELALYTFHYLDGASQVVVTFPPPPPANGKGSSGATATTAGIPTIAAGTSSTNGSSKSASTPIQAPSRVLLFRPEELTAQLEAPLHKTLTDKTPTVNTMSASPDAKTVERLTGNALYDSVLIQDQSSGLVMLLQPPSLGG
jgi:hypothetical protein